MKEFWLLMVPLAPLLSAVVILSLRGRSTRAAAFINLGGLAVSLLAVLLAGTGPVQVETLWMGSGSFQLMVGLEMDGLSQVMALMVTSIALLTGWYSAGYMAEEKSWFFALMAVFAGAMLTLVLASSFVLLFAAWEGVGVCSFLLIAYHYRDPQSCRAARKAFLMTRLGDLAFLLGWLLVLNLTGSTRISSFLDTVETFAPEMLSAIALLFLLAAVGKSAQLPLTGWLPDAMVAPSPVSALIHSATMVAAGVYLLLRCYPLFEAAPNVLEVVMWGGGLTALGGALAATAATDSKRMLAWSTSSQLGEMFMAIGLTGPFAAGFHLVTHAIFKSTLFLAAGAVEHRTGTRDLGRLGGMLRAMPVTALAFAAAGLAQAGIWPFAGGWSEHAILAVAVKKSWLAGGFVFLLVFLAGIYISRCAVSIFLAPAPGGAPRPKPPSGEGFMRSALIVLALGAIGAGWAFEGAIRRELSFGHPQEIGMAWKFGGVLAGLLGLILGGWRARSRGAVPAFGISFAWYAWALEWLSRTVGRISTGAAHLCRTLERALARGAEMIGDGAITASRPVRAMERALARAAGGIGDGAVAASRPVSAIERSLDEGGRALGLEADSLGRLTSDIERGGFSRWFDAVGESLSRAGANLRRAETGKLYLYTFWLFAWALIIGLISLFHWQ